MQGCNPTPGRNLRGRQDDGFTLLGLLFAMAIAGILAAVAVPAWERFEQDAAISSSAASLSAAESALFQCAAEGTGATISAQYPKNGDTTTTTLEVRNGNDGFCWEGHLADGAVPLVSGNLLNCTSVTATGLTAATASCQSPQSGPWSVRYEGLSANVS